MKTYTVTYRVSHIFTREIEAESFEDALHEALDELEEQGNALFVDGEPAEVEGGEIVRVDDPSGTSCDVEDGEYLDPPPDEEDDNEEEG